MAPILSLLVVSITLPIGTAQSKRDVVPRAGKTAWVYWEIADLKSKGLFVEYPDGLGPMSRDDMAQGINATCLRLHSMLAGSRDWNAEVALYAG